MNKTVLYIATSLNGFIARPDGSIDWLTSIPHPQTGDYGYSELLDSIGTIIMGRKTYDELIGFGVNWPYSGFDTYVVTTNRNLKIQSPNTYLLTEKIKDNLNEIKKKKNKDIWLVGGGQLITEFINEELLDKMIIAVIPKIIGEGIPLFADKPKETNWKLIEAKQFETGVVNLTYEKDY
jgi:dihydrofolate reductase